MNHSTSPVSAKRVPATEDPHADRHRELFESLAVGVVVQAGDGTIVSCNPAAEQILGLSFEQMVGRSSTDPRWRTLHADGSLYHGDTHPAMVALRTGVPVRDAVMGVARPDGMMSWLSVTAQPVGAGPDGPARSVVTSFTDITTLVDARRHAQELSERLSLATDAGGIGILEWRFDSAVAICDPVACALLDLPRGGGERSTHEIFARFEPHDRQLFQERFAAVMREGARLDGAFWIRTTQGERRRVVGRSVVHRDQDGVAQRLVGILRNTSAQAELRESRLALVAAERASRAKSELLARVSHDLRTPLNAILGFAQLLTLQPDAPAPEIREHGERIVAAGRHLLSVVTDLLDTSQIEAGTLRIRVEPVALDALLASVVAMAGAEAAAAGVHLRHDVSGALRVRADPTRLRQVLGNLVGNAIRYNRPGGSVLLRVRPVGESVRIDVIDNGTGIAAEDLDGIFEPFRRGRHAGTASRDGTGLGLTISRGLVAGMGGRLYVRSKPDAGSVFSVELPSIDLPSV